MNNIQVLRSTFIELTRLLLASFLFLIADEGETPAKKSKKEKKKKKEKEAKVTEEEPEEQAETSTVAVRM